jgi:hypothetical protein
MTLYDRAFEVFVLVLVIVALMIAKFLLSGPFDHRRDRR